jgi:bifunctional non-homologous end joining protein LigD
VYEPKYDGFRAIVSTVDGFRIRSRRGWRMESLLPELEELPTGLIVDGELVALTGKSGVPHFPHVVRRLLHGDQQVPLVYVIFDLLYRDEEPLVSRPWQERREELEKLDLNADRWHTTAVFDDGHALNRSVRERGLEGIVAKPTGGAYRPGYRGWITIKNPDYWRRDSELQAVASSRPSRWHQAI